MLHPSCLLVPLGTLGDHDMTTFFPYAQCLPNLPENASLNF